MLFNVPAKGFSGHVFYTANSTIRPLRPYSTDLLQVCYEFTGIIY